MIETKIIFRKFTKFQKSKISNFQSFTWSFHLKSTFSDFQLCFLKNQNFDFFYQKCFSDFFFVEVYQISCRLSTILRPSDLSGKNCARFSPKSPFTEQAFTSARLRGGSGIWPSRLSLTRCISELRWSLEECYGANQRRIIRTERWNHLDGARTLPEEMKSKKFFFPPENAGIRDT